MSTRAARTIALIRLGALGDLVLTGALARTLAEAGHRVSVVTAERYAEIAERLTGVARVVRFRPARHRGLLGLRALGAEVGPVDLVVDLQNKVRTRLLARWVRARERRHLVLRSPADAVRAALGRDPVRHDRHQRELLLDLAADLIGPAPALPPEIAPPGPRRDHLVLVPGARHAVKRWPPERFGLLAGRLRARGRDVIIGVGPDEAELVEQIQGAAGSQLSHTLGRPLAELAERCATARAVVAGDTGPAHLAAAFGTPVVSLFGPTSERRWRPLGEVELVALELSCRPCTNHGGDRCPLRHHRCMQDLSVDAVEAALEHLLARGGA